MIVPMKKVSFVLLESERKEALKKLRSLGAVHLEQLQGSSVELSQITASHQKIEEAFLLLSDVKVPKNLKLEEQNLSVEESVSAAVDVAGFYAAKKNFEEEIVLAQKEIERLSLWGSVNYSDFDYLASKGIRLSMFEIPSAKYALIPESVKTIRVKTFKDTVCFLLIEDDDSCRSALPPEAFYVNPGDVSTIELSANIVQYRAEIESIQNDIFNAVSFRASFIQAMKKLAKEIEFENAYSGMQRENEGSYALAWLTGYVPHNVCTTVQAAAAEHCWGFMADDPAEEDEVPTKLKNNKIVSLIYPVSDFLGTVPGYREYDISGWFLLFFAIFFGMIFGDGGYGLLMVLAAAGAAAFSVSKKAKPAPAVTLLMLLGIITMVWGTVTCTWFGIAPEMLPSILRDISFKPLSSAVSMLSAEDELRVKQNMQVFCFTLALFQLTVAHVKGIVRHRKSARFLGEAGSLLMLWGIFNIVLNMVVDKTRFPVLPASLIAISTGFVLSFVFSNYAGNLGQSILESCKNIISVLLGVVNVFSDIVSYIRLWAVGLAGSAISATVNEMAGPALGGFIIFMGILLLVFGHGLNMILNVLSVIVHGVRLNTLEFSSHLGMSWSGFKYQPFSETADK